MPTLKRKTDFSAESINRLGVSNSLFLANQPSHPLNMIRHSRDIRTILLVLRKHKGGVDIDHDNAIDLVPSRSDLLDDVVRHVTADVVEMPRSRMGPDDGCSGDFPILDKMSDVIVWRGGCANKVCTAVSSET